MFTAQTQEAKPSRTWIEGPSSQDPSSGEHGGLSRRVGWRDGPWGQESRSRQSPGIGGVAAQVWGWRLGRRWGVENESPPFLLGLTFFYAITLTKVGVGF